MAPKGKKGKKGKPALGDWGSDGDEDPPGLDPVAAAAKGSAAADEAASSDAPAVAKQAPGKGKGKKAKKGKGQKALGDWSDEDEVPPPVPAAAAASDEEDEEEEVQPATRGGSGGSGGFAALPDEGEDNDDASDQNGAVGSDSDDGSIDPIEPIVAKVTKVSKHPKSDRLKVCQMDTGSGSVQVVTNATSITAGMAVILAPAGCTTPGTAVRVEEAEVRGVASGGMVCCAADLGWADEADGMPAYVPPDTAPGTLFPEEPYPAPAAAASEDDEETVPQIKKGKGSKGKKSKKDISFADLPDEDGDAAEAAAEAAMEAAASRAKPKKGKKGKKSISFADLPSDDDGAAPPPIASATAASDDEAEEPLLPMKKGKKGKKGKKAAISFAELPSDDDVPAESNSPAAEEAGGAANGLASADSDDEPLQLSGKKKKKGKKGAFVMPAELGEDGAMPDAAGESGSGSLPDANLPENDGGAEEALSFGKKKKKKGASKTVDLDTAFAALDMDAQPGSPSADATGEPSDEAETVSGSKKGKKKKKGAAAVDWGALEEAEEDAATAEAPAQAPSEPVNATSPAADEAGAAVDATGKGKGGKSKADQEDIDALLAELEAPKQPAGEGGGKKKKKKKGGAMAKPADEDIDALLAELGEKPPAADAAATAADSDATPAADAARAADAVAAEGAAPAEAEASAEGAAGAVGDEDGDADAEGGKEMSAAAKKKAKKKAKEKAKKEAGSDAPAPAAAAAAPKKVNAKVRAMQELQELRRREEEAARIAEEERKRQEEEAEQAEKEAAEKKEAADKVRREARAEHRAQLKREGKLLTGKAKKEADRLAAMREQLLAKADISLDGDKETAIKKKVVYARKKPAKKPAADAAAEEEAAKAAAAAAEAEAAAATLAEEQRVAAEKAAAEEAAAKEAEAKAVEAEAAAAGVAEESSEGEDWDAVDVDQLELPEQKAARLKAEAKAAAMAEAEAAAEAEAQQREAEEAAATAKAAAAKATKAAVPKAAGAADAASEAEDEDDGDDESGSAQESGSEEESGSEDEDSDESDSEEEYSTSYESETDSEEAREARIAASRAARDERIRVARLNASENDLRSPICCILGHVDTGKTKILDNVRRTNVQDGEAGGITQQIGATYVPGDNIRTRTESLRKGRTFDLRVPGLLIIDTPGHESFTNLRSRGSSLCDIAILVVDLMHGLEPQTIESINLLKQRKTPFIIALNKVDRLFDWTAHKDAPIQDSFAGQKPHVNTEFRQRYNESKLNLNEQGLNVALYWENPDPRKFVNIVPTSAITGEGIPDLLQLLVKLTQSMMVERLKFVDELQATVLEVKVIEGLGTTMDVVLVNGTMREGAQIVVCGLGAPIVTNIRSLLTPHPMKELRVKGSYLHHKEIKAAQGIKIAANGLESAVAGTQLLVVQQGDHIEALKEEVMSDMADIFSSVDKGGEGVCVQASTLGSLEALLTFLKSDAVQIPVSGINIGPIHKKDVMRASVMLEKGAKKFAVILAFDVPVTREAKELAESMGVRIFTADIIYHLFDQFSAYLKHCKEDEKEAARLDAVFPCILSIVKNGVFNKKDPIVLGVEVMEGICKVGTPLCARLKNGTQVDLGRIASIEHNKKGVDLAKRGAAVAIKIEPTSAKESSILVGRHFDENDDLYSVISRKSINLLKDNFKEDLTKDDWRLVVKLKSVFEIQ
eukprot:CAMPEP_0206140654 /NCGR_PEP_ID=MMETSP1473-20131121/10223_1 /ASSEMBLY_ACC=CAM_ASM_001109 /TAXON_ID=1461547 /ORGANISM="Stichococcus sp, Strain RCC1054" /LENGTH=1691 /DNA_ID=CAMNT_0053534881 /DNA_START=139 /DNA_END=5214 /DNA_ORIENTATION=-